MSTCNPRTDPGGNFLLQKVGIGFAELRAIPLGEAARELSGPDENLPFTEHVIGELLSHPSSQLALLLNYVQNRYLLRASQSIKICRQSNRWYVRTHASTFSCWRNKISKVQSQRTEKKR